jgi:hypothetical protein
LFDGESAAAIILVCAFMPVRSATAGLEVGTRFLVLGDALQCAEPGLLLHPASGPAGRGSGCNRSLSGVIFALLGELEVRAMLYRRLA